MHFFSFVSILSFCVWGGISLAVLGVAVHILASKRLDEPLSVRLFFSGLGIIMAVGVGLVGKSQFLHESWRTSTSLRCGVVLLLFALLPPWSRWINSSGTEKENEVV